MKKMICDNLSVNEKGELCFAGRSTVELAKKYDTPVYFFDEKKIRSNVRLYLDAMNKAFDGNATVLFASKAASFKSIYKIVADEGMGADVVSIGEIYTAKSANFHMENIYFHGNNKTDYDIEFSIDNGVGCIIADNFEEIDAIESICSARGITQKVMLRLTPGIDPHTYEEVATGKVDSKFGSAIETGAAEKITKYTLDKEHIDLCGFHCHVGSQVFDSDVYIASAKVMIKFMAEMNEKYGYVTKELNLGGGYGVRYVDEDPEIDIAANIEQVSVELKTLMSSYNMPMPKIIMEPGRSIVADAGMTLYTVGTVKCIPEYKNYVSIDGGMGDNPRYALYKSKYTVICANKANDECDFECSVVGRCCESGDIIAENVKMPSSIKRGDLVAVLTTGAYNYSMSSNYNRLPKPGIVMINGDEDYVAVKAETLDDLIRNDM